MTVAACALVLCLLVLSLAHTVVCALDSVDIEDWILVGVGAVVTGLCGLLAWVVLAGRHVR